MNNPPRQTPLEKLLADKQRIRQACSEQEHKINLTLAYMHENGRSLLLSGLSTLLFPSRPGKKGKTAPALPAKPAAKPEPTLGLSDYWAVGKSMVPFVWELARPLVVSWGIRAVRKKMTDLFFSSSKSPEKKK